MAKVLVANNFRVACRRVVKNRNYALINILGLALGLSIFLFVTTFAHYERTYDSFFENADRIYVPHYDFGPNAPWGGRYSVSTRPALEPYFRELTGVEAVTSVGTFQSVADIGQGKKFTEVVRTVGPNFFTMFDFDFLAGTPDVFQNDTASILLSNRLAEKFFGGTSALGQTITIDGKASFRVAGIFKDVPKNSHFMSAWNPAQLVGFDLLLPEEALNILGRRERAQEWRSSHAFKTLYMQLQSGVEPSDLASAMTGVVDSHLRPDLLAQGPWGHEPIKEETSIKLRPIEGMNMFLWEVLNIPGPFIAEFLGFLVLVAAAMNYTGLAIAQVIGRSKEVAVRKTLGATRSNLFFQFMAESFIIVLVAGLFSVALLEFLLPYCGDLIGRNLALDIYDGPERFAFFALTLVFTGFAAGAYPGLILARMQVTDIFSGTVFRGSRRKKLRSTMLVLQFALTAVFLAFVVVMVLQFRKAWVGTDAFDADNMVLMRSKDEDILTRASALKAELWQTGVVNDVSITSALPFGNFNNGYFVEANNRIAPVLASYKQTDEAYFNIFNIELLAGRMLTGDRDSIPQQEVGETLYGKVVITRSMARALGWQKPSEAIDRTIISFGDSHPTKLDFTIVGVVEDLAVDDPTIEFMPIIYAINTTSYARVVVAISPDADQTTVQASLREVWTRVFGDTSQRLNVRSLKDWYNRGKETLGALLSGFVAISLAALGLSIIGLFGFAAFMAETRSMEMSIRKVYGATRRDIVRIMLWQFIRPSFWGALIGILIAYAAIQQILQTYFNSTPLEFLPSAAIVGFLMLLAWGTTLAHALRVAATPPIAHLRHD